MTLAPLTTPSVRVGQGGFQRVWSGLWRKKRQGRRSSRVIARELNRQNCVVCLCVCGVFVWFVWFVCCCVLLCVVVCCCCCVVVLLCCCVVVCCCVCCVLH